MLHVTLLLLIKVTDFIEKHNTIIKSSISSRAGTIIKKISLKGDPPTKKDFDRPQIA